MVGMEAIINLFCGMDLLSRLAVSVSSISHDY